MVDRRDTLVDRLRGVYTVPVDDGAGPLNGSETFTRQFQGLPPIHEEAAVEIERLRELNSALSGEVRELRMVIAGLVLTAGGQLPVSEKNQALAMGDDVELETRYDQENRRSIIRCRRKGGGPPAGGEDGFVGRWEPMDICDVMVDMARDHGADELAVAIRDMFNEFAPLGGYIGYVRACDRCDPAVIKFLKSFIPNHRM